METRELPRAEWGRLAHTDLWEMLSEKPDAVVSVIVVEDGEGAIVGCWSLVNVVHAEGVWIAPAHRRGAAVARALIGRMWQLIGKLGLDGVWTAADSPEVAVALDKLGAQRLPITPYYWQRRRHSERIGATFHRTFELSAGHPPDHPPLPDHDRAVGEAIVRAFTGDTSGAESTYNAWADSAGFERAEFLGKLADGRIHVKSGQYRFMIAPSGVCEVIESCQSGRQ